MAESWRTVADFVDYDVSDLGRVRSRKAPGEPRILRQGVGGRTPYPTVGLSRYGVQKTLAVHRLVAAAFLPAGGPVVRHLDGNPLNNAASNLARGTQLENIGDIVRTPRTHCSREHALTPDNTYTSPAGWRRCRTCMGHKETSMALRARFTKPLQVVAEPELKDRFQVVADREGVSLASVYRDVLWAGITKREELSARRAAAAN